MKEYEILVINSGKERNAKYFNRHNSTILKNFKSKQFYHKCKKENIKNIYI